MSCSCPAGFKDNLPSAESGSRSPLIPSCGPTVCWDLRALALHPANSQERRENHTDILEARSRSVEHNLHPHPSGQNESDGPTQMSGGCRCLYVSRGRDVVNLSHCPHFRLLDRDIADGVRGMSLVPGNCTEARV